MLVLARQPGQKIILPAIDTTIEICRVKGDTVRVGIQAPNGILVLRDELADPATPYQSILDGFEQARKINHQLRGQLHAVSLQAALVRKQLEAGAPLAELYETLDMMGRSSLVDEKSKVDDWKPLALVVEDDRNERELLAGVLRMSGIRVIAAGDGHEALDRLKEAKPDVVLLDMGLPNLTGAEVADRIRANPEHDRLKIFVISGQDRNEGAKVDRWFQKPLDPAALVQNIRQIKAG